MPKKYLIPVGCCTVVWAYGTKSGPGTAKKKYTACMPVQRIMAENLPVKPCDLLYQAKLIGFSSLATNAKLKPYPNTDTPHSCALGFQDGDRPAAIPVKILEGQYGPGEWQERSGPLLAVGTEASLNTDRAGMAIWLGGNGRRHHHPLQNQQPQCPRPA